MNISALFHDERGKLTIQKIMEEPEIKSVMAKLKKNKLVRPDGIIM